MDAKKPAVVVDITPQMATDWLGDMLTYQRKLKLGKQKQFAADMTKGQWLVNGETIILSNQNPPRVLDGQHRLRGCILANVSFKSYVVYNMDPDVYHSIDQGTSRSAIDVLDIDSKFTDRAPIRNLAKVSAATALCFDYQRGSFRKARAVPREVRDYLRKNPMIEQWVADALSQGTATTNSYAAFIAAVAHLVADKFPQEAKEFVHLFVTGENLSRGNAILALRRYLLDEGPKSKSAYSRKNTFIVVAKAWNAFVNDETIGHLRMQKNFVVLKGGPPIEGDIDDPE